MEIDVRSSLDTLFGNEDEKVLSRRQVASEMENLVKSLKSATEVSHLYGVSRQSVNTRAARLRKKYGTFGWQMGSVWVFTPDEVAELEPGAPGRPVRSAP